jgi:diamine N-acetyltransferase
MLPAGFHISAARAEDADRLMRVTIKTFSETFEHLNDPEDFRKYVDDHFNLTRIAKDLADKDVFCFLARVHENVAGYLKLNAPGSQTEEVKGDSLEIERIYVLKKFHGLGIGNALLNTAIQQAKEMKKDFLWLGVWEKNEKAISFYERKGFRKFDTHIFRLGNDDQTDYLYKLKIKK